MTEITNQSLQKIAQGAGIMFISTIIGMFFGFLTRVVIIRNISQSEYGYFSLAIVIITIFATIANLGLGEGSARYISFFRGKNDNDKANGIVFSSLKIVLCTGILFAITSFFLSDFISNTIFHIPGLVVPLKILSIAIPFILWINVFISIFRGFCIAEPSIFFQGVIINIAFLGLISIFFSLGWDFFGVLLAYVLSNIITLLIFISYIQKKYSLDASVVSKFIDVDAHLTRDLIFFSIPLFFIGILITASSWIDILILGYFRTPDELALFNAAFSLTLFLTVAVVCIGFLYTPVVSQLFAQNKMDEVKRSYVLLTKWGYIGTFPIFFVLFFYPGVILSALYGYSYGEAGTALQIISIGYFVLALTGYNYNTLVAMGRNNWVLSIFLITLVINIALDIFLIPVYGILGAAISSACIVSLSNLLLSFALYHFIKIHPITKSYLKCVIFSLFLMVSLYLIFNTLVVVTIWIVPCIFGCLLIIFIPFILLAKVLEREDIALLLKIENFFGWDLYRAKNLLKKFI